MRVIPNWAAVSAVMGLLVMAGGWIWQAASAVSALQANTKSLEQMTSAVTQLRNDVALSQRDAAVHAVEIGNMKAQMMAVDARLSTVERGKH